MEDFFVAENLRRTFGGLRAEASLSVDVSLSCAEGTMTGIVGASGSGKSTVLRLIAGLEKNDAGAESRITLGGVDIGRLPPGRRGVGMVFQGGALFDHMSVADNVAYGLVSRGMRRKAAREMAEEMLGRFGLGGFGRRTPDTLSGGEAQRVSLARTLILRPRLVLFDEPLSALDAPLRKRLAEEIRSLQSEFGFTGLLVTHDIDEAKSLCTGIRLMRAGRIAWSGTADEFGIERYGE